MRVSDTPSPYPEIPAIYVPGAALNQSVTSALSTTLNELPERVIVNSMFPADCANISLCMKKFVTGFLAEAEQSTSRRATRSLSENNVQLLRSWYRHTVDSGASPPVLVVVLNEIEQFDPEVLQDMFAIIRYTTSADLSMKSIQCTLV
ncbi:hypothetical protein BDV98DRAFT_560408 [Pterulicium gracile]|uniref:Origin recognition complex subunit 3 N-terminal domain-containing protein n=1 Tax=Pterulicium gracile TaxID=1884261 RepID=A0A5C3QWD7_9AGAR|nr:hypothetical protein BDV98DRAFT_560408 [Pterula gracilis]